MSKPCKRRSVLTRRLIRAMDSGARGRLQRRLCAKLVRYYSDGQTRVVLAGLIMMGVTIKAAAEARAKLAAIQAKATLKKGAFTSALDAALPAPDKKARVRAFKNLEAKPVKKDKR